MITCESLDRFLTVQVNGYENGRIEITDLKISIDNTTYTNQNSQSISFFSHSGPVTSVSFGSVDEIPYFISSGSDGKLILWNKIRGTWSQKILVKSENPITSASFSGDSSLIAYADQKGNIKFISTKNFEIDDHAINTGNTGIHQICFVKHQDIDCLAIITPNGNLHLIKKDNNKYLMKPFVTTQFSKSYVKSIAPLDQCYIAGVCFENIVRIIDLKTFSKTKIQLKISQEMDNEDTVYFINYNPIYSLYWQQPLRKLVLSIQKPYQVLNYITNDSSQYITPAIEKEKYIFSKDLLGNWNQIEPKNK